MGCLYYIEEDSFNSLRQRAYLTNAAKYPGDEHREKRNVANRTALTLVTMFWRYKTTYDNISTTPEVVSTEVINAW